MELEKEHDWPMLREEFRIMSAWTLWRMSSFERFQTINERDVWMGMDNQPMALLFLSHRWDVPDHPDPSGQQLQTLQALVKRTCVVIRTLFTDRAQRLASVPKLDKEGTLQAEELARRILGFGPFSGGNTVRNGRESRTEIREKLQALDPESFDRWMLGQIGLWVDYCCVPQPPRTDAEQAIFERTLMRLDGLLSSSTVVALRRKGDDYAERAWCVSEIWLSAKQSFARSLFIDMDRVRDSLPVVVPSPPSTTDPMALGVLKDGYESDREAFRDAVARWKTTKGLLEHAPPDAWSAYRSLQGSGFFALEDDPNPARRGIEVVRSLSTGMIQHWWMSDVPVTFNLTEFLDQTIAQNGLLSTDPSDRIYLGLLLSSAGWITALRPFFRTCMEAFLRNRGVLEVELKPIAPELRAILTSVRPSSPSAWLSRLSTQTGHRPEERVAIEMLQRGLTESPLAWTLVQRGTS